MAYIDFKEFEREFRPATDRLDFLLTQTEWCLKEFEFAQKRLINCPSYFRQAYEESAAKARGHYERTRQLLLEV